MVFQKNFDRLVTVVAVPEFATKAFSKKLIDKELMNTSASGVLKAVLNKIYYNDSYFDTFIKILEEIPSLKGLAGDLLADLPAQIEPPPSFGGQSLSDRPASGSSARGGRRMQSVISDEDFDSGVSGLNNEQSSVVSPSGNDLPEQGPSQSFVNSPHNGTPSNTSGIQETHGLSHNYDDWLPKLEPAVDFGSSNVTTTSNLQSHRTNPMPVPAPHVTTSDLLEPSKDTNVPSEAEKPLVENDEPIGGLSMSTEASGSSSTQGAMLIVPKKKQVTRRDSQEQSSSADSVDNIVEQLQSIRNDLRQTKAENQHYIAEKTELQEKVQEMEEKFDMLEVELQETKAVVEAKNTEIASLKGEIQQYQETIADYKSQIASIEKKNEDERKMYAIQIKELQDKLKQKKSEHDQMVLKLTKETHELQLKVESMHTEEEKLKRRLAEAREDLSNLKLKMTKEKLENELAFHKSESQAQIARKDERIQHLERLLSQTSFSSQASSDSAYTNCPA